VSPEVFAEWLLEDQLAYLDANLTESNLDGLWALCACSLDSASLVHLAGRAVAAGLPIAGSWLLSLQPAVLSAVLALDGLAAPAAEAWRSARLSDLVAFCLLDRYLRRSATELWEGLTQGVQAEAEELLGAGLSPHEGLLMRLQGQQQRVLSRRFPEAWGRWDSAWKESARAAIRILAQRPRDVSQANAERLLSQQVYTDPGHFLLELLQNADDAGATFFAVEFTETALTVRHDGAPFDFRDLVGVLSIGQTTKKSTQIGYFGVGFKSVFEVAERPRLYSGHFAFEIADISVPRPLAPRPEQAGLETLLVLPLKSSSDAEIAWTKALQIQPALLLNVPHLRRLSWRKGKEIFEIGLRCGEDGTAVLSHRGGESHYLLWTGVYRHEGRRPPGKPARATVRLAIPIDGQSPSTTLYSFLPVAETSGLSFIVGSHFDVPVDRERLDVTSSWNQGVVSAIPGILAQHFAADPELGWRLLPRLPLPEDPLGPLFVSLPEQIARALGGLPILPKGRRAEQSRLLAEELKGLFELEHDLLCPREPRLRRWLQQLGTPAYELQHLLEELAQGRFPGRLAKGELSAWTDLHAILFRSAVELDDIPVLLDDELRPLSPRQALLMEESFFRLFITPPRRVHPFFALHSDSIGLLTRLAVPRFDWAGLLHELRSHGTSRLDRERLFELLSEAPRGVTVACLELPIFVDQHGCPGCLVLGAVHYLGILAATPGLPSDLWPEGRFLACSPALDALLDSLRWPRFTLPDLVQALDRRPLQPKECDRLLECIERGEVSWDGQALDDLAGMPIFESQDGSRLSLSQFWLLGDEGLADLLPGLARLAPDSASSRVVDKLALWHRLSRADLDTLLARLPGSQPEVALKYLAGRCESLSRAQLARLLRLPLFDGQPLDWPGADGKNGLLAAAPEYADLFAAMGMAVLTRDSTETVLPLLRACAYPLLGLAQLLELLKSRAPSLELLPSLHRQLLAEATSLDLAFSKEYRQRIPVWPTCSGRVLPAVEVPPSAELAKLIGKPDQLPAGPVEPELSQLFPFLDDESFLRQTLQREARPGWPLREQPFWCDTVAKIDNLARHLPLSYLMVNAEEVVCEHGLNRAPVSAYRWLVRSRLGADLLHPESSLEQQRECSALDAALVLETFYPLRHDRAIRQAFYEYLQTELGQLAVQPDARAFLTEAPIWLSSEGNWKTLEQLILEPELASLGGDWSPHPEIPGPLLCALQTGLGLEKPEPEMLLRDHLLPAYQQRPSARAALLDVMARLGSGLDSARLRRILRGPDCQDSFPLPRGGDLLRVYHPPEGLAALPGLPAFSSVQLPFLRRLGLPYLPSADALRGLAFSLQDGEALLRLVDWAWQQQPEELHGLWEALTVIAWMPARDGRMRLPRQLFLPSPEIEELVGCSPELYLSARIPVGLARRLGLKDESQIDGVMVLQHLLGTVARRERVGSRLYAFLDRSLEEGRLNPSYLLEQLKDVSWIWTDEGEYRPARQVLAVPSFRYFGPYRGTWEAAHRRYPRLAELFGIGTSISPQVVRDFLHEVHQGGMEPSRRLLLACLVFLGDSDSELPRDWKVLPATVAASGQPILVAAEETGLVRSNSPTLVALFAGAGRLLVVDGGDADSGSSLEKLYGRVGIPRLRDAYTVRPDRRGREVGAEMVEQVLAFRTMLRGLAAVIPRLRAARPEWEDGEWLLQSRLQHFMTSGPIRVLEELRLTYELPGVASVAVEAAAAFDPSHGELLVGAPAIADPAADAVALAEGLVDLIYQGPGSEGLVDLLNLLIPLGRREGMDAYLDRRHFPRSTVDDVSPGVRGRVGEILDYGLHKVLERRFPELRGANWGGWQSGELRLSEEPGLAASQLVEALVGAEQKPSELQSILTRLLSAPELEDALPGLWQHGPQVGDSTSKVAAPTPPATATPASLAVRGADASTPVGLAGVGQRVLGRLGQWLGVAPVQRLAVLGFRKEISDVAETYRHPPPRHLLVSSRSLSAHDLYCLSALGVEFDPRRQLYLPAPVPWPPWFVPSGKRLDFHGRLYDGDAPLPLPMYSRLLAPPTVRGGRATLAGPDGQALYRLALKDPESELSYSVELCSRPELEGATRDNRENHPRLLKPTAPLASLPPLVIEWISWARGSGLPHWQLAQRARDFVIAHYRYDLGFLDSPERQEQASKPYRGDENRILTMLHAGAGGSCLGRGICLELSAVLLEMLRRARIPAVLASAWMLDMGLIHAPDHAVVLAYLPAAGGAVWVPLEPSENRMRRSEEEPVMARADLLQVAADLVLGPSFSASAAAGEKEQALERALLNALESSRRLEILLECIARPGRYLREVDPELRWLTERGLLTVDREELYRVSPRHRQGR
jgi:hypothetical protein